MKQREIVINDAGVTAFESTLGLAASGHDLEIALGAEGVRDLPPLRVRQLSPTSRIRPLKNYF